jgi:hypothetical protein
MMEFVSPVTDGHAVAEPTSAVPSASASRSGRRRLLTPSVLVPAAYLAAALVLTWRLWADPASRIVAANPTDADLFAWYLRYAAVAVSHGRLPALVSSAMNAPQGVNMMWNTSLLLPGVILAPVTLLLGPQVSLTILTTAGMAGSATALYAVLRGRRFSVGASALAGAVYGFSPALMHSAVGHYNLQFAVLPPLIVDASVRLAAGRRTAGGSEAADDETETGARTAGTRRFARLLARVPPAVRDGAWLGLLMTAQLFISEELALLTALTAVLLVALLAISRPLAAARRALPVLAGLAVATGVTMLLAGHALHTQFYGALVQHGPLFPPDYYVNDMTSFVTPSAQELIHTAGTIATAARYQGGMTEYLGYLGWPLIIALACAAVACWRRPAGFALTLTLAALLVFSLGGHPLAGGHTDLAVNLPWHWLEEHPLLASVLPDRLSIMADGIAAVLLALGVDAVSARWKSEPNSRQNRRWPAVVLAVAALACVPLLPRVLPEQGVTPLPAGWSHAFARLGLSPGSRVLVVPVPTNILTAAMRWQADTGQPVSMVGGYFIGPGYEGQAYLGGSGVRPTAWYLDRLWAAGLAPDSPLASAAWQAGLPTAGPSGYPATGPPPAMTALEADFTFWRPSAIVAVTAAASPLGRYLIRLLGPPAIRSGDVLAWRSAHGGG